MPITYGEKNEFAIDLDIIGDDLNENSLTRARLWLKNECLGNNDEVSLLKLLVSGLKGVKERLGRQGKVEKFEEIERAPQDLFGELYRAIWGDGRSPEAFPMLADVADLYWGLPTGVEVFDGEAMFVIKFVDHDFVLWRAWGEREVKSARLHVDQVSMIIEKVLDGFSKKFLAI